MDFEILHFEKISAGDWDDLVEHSPDGFVFALSYWQAIVMGVNEWGYKDYSFGIRENNKLIGVMPLHYREANKTMWSGGWGGSGPVLAGTLGYKQRKKAAKSMFAYAEHCAAVAGAEILSFCLPPTTETSLCARWGVSPWFGYGFRNSSGVVRIVDLSKDKNELWKGINPQTRTCINHAIKEGYEVHRGIWEKELDEYYRLHVATYTRTGVPPIPKAYFAGIARVSAPDGHSVLWVCKDRNGKTVSYHNSSIFGSRGVYTSGCSDKTLAGSNSGALLFWRAMLGLKEMGLKWYEAGELFDVCDPGTPAKLVSLTSYKKKFGGENHYIFRYSKMLKKEPPARTQTQAPGRKQLAKNFLHAGKMLLESFIGHSCANSIGKFVKFPWRIIKKVENIRKRPSRIAFIRPSWRCADIVQSVAGINSANAVSATAHQLCQIFGMSSQGKMVLASSGRGALEFALRAAAELSPERSKVILPTYACKGVLDPVLNCGLTPVFIDCDPGTLLADPALIREQVADKSILACIYVYLGGVLQDMTSLREAAQSEGIFWIGDYCQSYLPNLPYEKDDFAVFSFSHGKILAATAGGAVYSLEHADALRLATAHAIRESSVYAIERLARQCLTYFTPWPLRKAGARVFRYAATHQFPPQRMSNMDARLLASQLPRLHAILQRREMVGQALRKVSPSAFLVPQGQRHLYTKFSLIAQTQEITDSLWTESVKNNIELEGMYTPLHLRQENTKFDFVNTHISESIYKKIFNIPCRENMTPSDIQRVGEMLCKVTRHI